MNLHALQPGYMLSEYRIDKLIGEGGFGLTYLAFDTNLDKSVAIKEYMPSDFALRQDDTNIVPKSVVTEDMYKWGLEAFLQEAKTLAKFNAPNIVQIYRFFKANGTAYLVMEYLEGGCLSDFFPKNESYQDEQTRVLMSEARVRNIIGPIMNGLQQVHDGGILHRDIKPSNIMFNKDKTPVLIDFGAARQAIEEKSRSLTAILTPGYAPLEQYSSKANLGPHTDIYALAAVAYLCLTGKKPDEATDRIINDEIQVLANRSNASAFLKSVDWGLAVSAKDMPQSLKTWYDAWDIADYPSTVPFEPPVLEKEIQKEPAVRSAPELYPPPQGEPKPDQPVVLNGNKQAKSPNTSNIAVKKLMVISGFCLVFLFSIIANVLYYGPSESEGSFAHDVKNLSEQFDLIAADSTIDNKAFKLFIEQYELSPVMVQGQWKSNVYLERMKHQNSTELGHQIKNNKIKQMLDKLEDFEFDQVDRDKLSVDSQLKLKIHQVEMDETLSSISRKYDIALGKLLAQNPGNGDKIFPGQKLVIPNDKNSASQIVDVIELKRTFNVVNRDKELGLDNLKAFYLVWVRLNASTKLGIFNYTGFLTLNSRLQGELTAINQGVKVRSNIERAWVKLIANKFAKVKRKMRHLSL